ncbi:hypothetical protein D3C77_562860 [compost metagenome]
MLQLRVGFSRIAHALDQQAQAMTVMGRVLQRFTQFAPLLFQALVDALVQVAHQAFTLSCPQENRKCIDNRQQSTQFGTGSDAGEGFPAMRQTRLRRCQLIALKQLCRQHLTVTQWRGQIAQRFRRAFKLLNPWQLL